MAWSGAARSGTALSGTARFGAARSGTAIIVWHGMSWTQRAPSPFWKFGNALITSATRAVTGLETRLRLAHVTSPAPEPGTAPCVYPMAAPHPQCHRYNTCYSYAKRRWQACSACGAEDRKNAVAPQGDYLCGRCWPLHVKDHCLCADALRLIQEHGGDPNATAGGKGSIGSGSAGGGSGCMFAATAPLQPVGLVPWQQGPSASSGPLAGGSGGAVGAEGTGGGKGVAIAGSLGTEGGKDRKGGKGGFGNDAEVGPGGQGGSYYGGRGQWGGGRTGDMATPAELLERRVQLLEDRLRLLELRFPYN